MTPPSPHPDRLGIGLTPSGEWVAMTDHLGGIVTAFGRTPDNALQALYQSLNLPLPEDAPARADGPHLPVDTVVLIRAAPGSTDPSFEAALDHGPGNVSPAGPVASGPTPAHALSALLDQLRRLH